MPSTASPKPNLVAPLWHTAVLILIFVAFALAGLQMQHRPGTGPSLTPEHRGIIPLYVSLICGEWGLVYFVWRGLRRAKSIGFLELVGGRWKTWRNVVIDLAIAAPFWVVWVATARFVHFLLGPSQAKTVSTLLPQRWLEVVLWVALSLSAGFAEEVVFRGYLQKQFQALTGSVTVAVLGQAAVFGGAHLYQGWKAVVVIAVLGVLYGMLAAWRQSLRPCMLAHAWSDVYEGYLKFLLAGGK
jgi:membrane protease YdiL (CAAX protease family)